MRHQVMRYQFNGYLVDTERFELSIEDQAVALEPQVLELMVLLIENRDRVVTKDEINERVWKGRIVSDSALSSRIKSLRQALGDDGRSQHTIRTIHKKGFRFVADITESGTDTSRWDDGLTAGGAPEPPAIAVLPFENMGGDREQEYFNDGITEDIITALSKISSMLVIARSSTLTYKGKAVDVKQVGREQGVKYVLEGSVRRAGKRVRVTAQLIDATSGHHIWAERYDRDLVDIFQVQDEIMREIVVALDVELREGEQARFWSSGTRNLEAWECVRLSTTDVLGGVEENKLRAKKLLEKALELDPDYAIAWVMLGYIHQYYADIAGGASDEHVSSDSREQMRHCARKAIEADPECADAYTLMAYYHREMNEFDQAMDYTEKSIELAPNNAENLASASGLMTKEGKSEHGLELIQRAMRACPNYRAGFLRALAQAHRFSGNPEAAVDAFRESLRRESTYLAPHVNLTSVLGELGRLDEAAEAARGIFKLDPDFSIGHYMNRVSYRNPEDKQRVEDGLRKAGLPE